MLIRGAQHPQQPLPSTTLAQPHREGKGARGSRFFQPHSPHSCQFLQQWGRNFPCTVPYPTSITSCLQVPLISPALITPSSDKAQPPASQSPRLQHPRKSQSLSSTHIAAPQCLQTQIFPILMLPDTITFYHPAPQHPTSKCLQIFTSLIPVQGFLQALKCSPPAPSTPALPNILIPPAPYTLIPPDTLTHPNNHTHTHTKPPKHTQIPPNLPAVPGTGGEEQLHHTIPSHCNPNPIPIPPPLDRSMMPRACSSLRLEQSSRMMPTVCSPCGSQSTPATDIPPDTAPAGSWSQSNRPSKGGEGRAGEERPALALPLPAPAPSGVPQGTQAAEEEGDHTAAQGT